MDVLMEVLLEFPQTVIECVKGRASILWGGEISAQTADFRSQGARSIVFLRHHRDRIRNRAKATTGPRGSNGNGPLQASDEGEQDGLFLRKMMGELLIQLHEPVGDHWQLGLRGAVAIHDLLSQLGQPRQFTFHVCVMFGYDVPAQALQRFLGPILDLGPRLFSTSSSAAITESISRFPAAHASARGLRPPQQ